MGQQSETRFDLRISGICIRINAPFAMELPWDLQPFISPIHQPDVTYDIRLLDEPLPIDSSLVLDSPQLRIYKDGADWLRLYPYLPDSNGCCAALRLCPNGHHILYLPAADLERYRLKGVLSPILGLEHIMMQAGCFILHSSVVVCHGRAVLFCGASGAGKSTQADLWAKHFGAKIINGDRCAVSIRPDGIYGCGSPFSGSSEIYLADEAPIAAIAFVHQGPENCLSPAPAIGAFTTLYAQTAANTWNSDYTQNLCTLLEQTITDVPLYDLTCRPDKEAADILYQALFGSTEGGSAQ